MENWKEHGKPFQNFNQERTQWWINNGFDLEETKEWLNVGLEFNDSNYAKWLRDVKNFDPAGMKNYIDRKRQKSKDASILSDDVINQIKKLLNRDLFSVPNLTSEQKSLIEELIPSKELKKRFKDYGLCQECNQPNTGWISWCRTCNSKHFQNELWSSGNKEVDSFIRDHQLKATNQEQIIEWIPYEEFTLDKKKDLIGEGGFGKVYKAKWSEGPIRRWNSEERKWTRSNPSNWLTAKIVKNIAWFLNMGDASDVALKSLNNSQNVKAETLNEILCYKKTGSSSMTMPCYGISQEPETKNYLIVSAYIKDGDLRKSNLDFFYDKLYQLIRIAQGLESLHEQGLIHKDFHPGNILRNGSAECYIADLGLCRPVNENDNEKIYGVLPYVAPEVLRGEPYSTTSDVYSFAMVSYRVLTGDTPFINENWEDMKFKKKIVCENLRPEWPESLKIPPLLIKLIEKCWDSDPEKRPKTKELSETLYHWYFDDMWDRKDAEFYHQYQQTGEKGGFHWHFSEEKDFWGYIYYIWNKRKKTERSDKKEFSKSIETKELMKKFNTQTLENEIDNNLNKMIEFKEKFVEIKKQFNGEINSLINQFIKLTFQLEKAETDNLIEQIEEVEKQLENCNVNREIISKLEDCCNKLAKLENFEEDRLDYLIEERNS